MRDEMIYCPRCESVQPHKLDGQRKRGECLTCGRSVCGHELAGFKALADSYEKALAAPFN